jgi:SAM-dependent methyltransferase
MMLLKANDDLKWQTLILRMLLEFPYLPSSLPVIDAALDLAGFSSSDVFADLGCGDGIVLAKAAEKFRVFSVGFEIDRRLINIAREKVKAAGFGGLVDVIYSDLFTIDISRFDVVYIYPYPPVVTRLSEKIINECSKGSRVLVHDYPLERLRPVKMISIPEGTFHTDTVYLYKL